MKFRAVVFSAVPLLIFLGACSSSTDSAGSNTAVETAALDSGASETVPTEAATIAADAVFNAGDVTFAQGMIPHHKQAVEMATIALDPARNAGAKVKDLATRIQGAQDPEIKLMTGWLSEWGQPVDAMAGMDHSNMDAEAMETMAGMAGMAGMEGMMTAAEMTGLEAATGPAFDKLWLDMMVRHHQGAVGMSKTLKTAGKAAVVKELAGQIITAQEAEIAEMQKLLAG